jgi:hypothetical protein
LPFADSASIATSSSADSFCTRGRESMRLRRADWRAWSQQRQIGCAM